MLRRIAVMTALGAVLGLSLAVTPASAGEPRLQITLDKTVTTEPGVCGTESEIEVAAGTTVYYCYTVTNTGNVALDVHSLSDDVLGPIFADLEYVLEPGASVDTVAAGLTVDDVVDVDTTNVAEWEACREFNAVVPLGNGVPCAYAEAEATVTVAATAPTTAETTTTSQAAAAAATRAAPSFTG
jgi:hypothetical protein